MRTPVASRDLPEHLEYRGFVVTSQVPEELVGLNDANPERFAGLRGEVPDVRGDDQVSIGLDGGR